MGRLQSHDSARRRIAPEEGEVEADGVEYTGKTVGDAVAEAEKALGLSRSDLDIDIITPGRTGVFGIGAENARIRARPKGAQPEPSQPEPVMQQEAAAETQTPTVEREAPVEPQARTVDREAPSDRHAANGDQEGPRGWAEDDEAEAPEREPVEAKPDPELAKNAHAVLGDLLETMGIEADISVRSDEPPVTLAINGENLGVLIGRRGDNLAALQFMVNLILAKNRRQWPRVVIDVENYRAKREESLRSLADRIAYRVRRNGQAFTLEAMPASDRRIIHLSLRDRTDLETYSIGEGPSRRVVIAPKRVARAPSDRGYSHSSHR